MHIDDILAKVRKHLMCFILVIGIKFINFVPVIVLIFPGICIHV